ncbi:helix-turn-helix domain-containing protein [Microcoleus sp. B3-D2]|nr:helix-turn-helix domain-containing protein [Microcoleus sp. FACHB-84]MBD2011165.1 helix-turn-helix domain-containing protein [Microcoleus sp. FACHB-45]
MNLRGVKRITVNRWLKQYSAGGLQKLLKIRHVTGRPGVILSPDTATPIND